MTKSHGKLWKIHLFTCYWCALYILHTQVSLRSFNFNLISIFVFQMKILTICPEFSIFYFTIISFQFNIIKYIKKFSSFWFAEDYHVMLYSDVLFSNKTQHRYLHAWLRSMNDNVARIRRLLNKRKWKIWFISKPSVLYIYI